ncbi:MAG: NDP-sugar synthase, partial [Dehalococcoidia bacterium]
MLYQQQQPLSIFVAGPDREPDSVPCPHLNRLSARTNNAKTEGKMHQDIKGVVLAGVHRWRDSGLERAVVAPLVPIANRPLIDYAMNWFRDGGVTRVGVCANSDTDILRRWLDDGSGHDLQIDYCEDEMPRGPAGCVRDAALEDDIQATVAIDASVIPQSIDLQRLLETHNRSHAAATIVVTHVEQDDARSSPSLTPAGITVFHGRALGYIPAHGYQDIKETLIPALYRAGERITTFQAEGAVPRVHDAGTCLSAEAWMLSRRLSGAHALTGYRRSGDTLIHETARVGPDARL